MFTMDVDEEIQLALVQPSFAAMYSELVTHNFAYLKEWLAWPEQCREEQDFVHFIQQSLNDYALGTSMVCAIFFENRLVGSAGFNSIDRHLKKAKIGYWLAESEQGKGIITRVCCKLIELAFEELKLEKIEISVAIENQSSRSVCDRLEMNLEGIITHAENLNGRIVDHAIYGLNKYR